ncbi:MAG: radical SAM protein [Deltaproteobacteria bacterium]|nr:radical SAM protein [Deltaproteobacteria bacterium]
MTAAVREIKGTSANGAPAGLSSPMEVPRKLFVETTTRCNLRCTMCVKQTKGNGIVEGDLSLATFEALAPAFPNLEALVLSGIGELLLHPGLVGFIRLARRAMPDSAWIGFQSNGLLLDDSRALSLVRSGLDRVCLSLDAVSPAAFRRIREGGEVGGVERALSALSRAEGAIGRRVDKGIEFVAMRDNVTELPEVVRWAAARGATFALVTQVLPYDESLVAQAACDPNTDVAVGFFEPWRDRARRENVDIGRYFEVLWKYTKTAEDQRIVDFVDAMKADAYARDLNPHQELIQRPSLGVTPAQRWNPGHVESSPRTAPRESHTPRPSCGSTSGERRGVPWRRRGSRSRR